MSEATITLLFMYVVATLMVMLVTGGYLSEAKKQPGSYWVREQRVAAIYFLLSPFWPLTFTFIGAKWLASVIKTAFFPDRKGMI